MHRVFVFDTTRDAEQWPGASMTLAQKLRMAHQLDALGVDMIEAGSPISSTDENWSPVVSFAASSRVRAVSAAASLPQRAARAADVPSATQNALLAVRG